MIVGIMFLALGNYYEANQQMSPGDPGKGIRLQFSGIGFIILSFFTALVTSLIWGGKLVYSFILDRITRA
jgi:hypothetical protein